MTSVSVMCALRSESSVCTAAPASAVTACVSVVLRRTEELGAVVDPLTGEVCQRLVSPASGLLFTLREYPVVYEGSLIARILGGGV